MSAIIYLCAHNLPVSGPKPVLVKRILEHKTDCNHGDNDVEEHLHQETSEEARILEDIDESDYSDGGENVASEEETESSDTSFDSDCSDDSPEVEKAPAAPTAKPTRSGRQPILRFRQY